MTSRIIISMLFLSLLTSCGATLYQKRALTGGYEVKHMEGDIYRVIFSSNGYTTRETTQTYWLYKCAELTIEKGFDGFKILSNITLTQQMDPELFFQEESVFKKAQYSYVPIYIQESFKPYIEADIKLLKLPFEHAPPKVFLANRLLEEMKQYVIGKKCKQGNVCEHVHGYLYNEQEL
ncbi:MAG: hypothetical protein JXA04_03150 [Gammaproteobacteria bacterium]|nr:hypothetical protein [Gammaproteobacteria bacterium]